MIKVCACVWRGGGGASSPASMVRIHWPYNTIAIPACASPNQSIDAPGGNQYRL
jgi:hypothetical protein